jgi:hypothetical protein
MATNDSAERPFAMLRLFAATASISLFPYFLVIVGVHNYQDYGYGLLLYSHSHDFRQYAKFTVPKINKRDSMWSYLVKIHHSYPSINLNHPFSPPSPPQSID